MGDKFQIKINHDTVAIIYATRNGCQWASVPIDTPKQMCQIAEVLIRKANELASDRCPDCGIELNQDYETMQDYEAVIDSLPPNYLIYWCENCEKAFNGLGEEI
jgi:uncharacterized protein with PIN domain